MNDISDELGISVATCCVNVTSNVAFNIAFNIAFNVAFVWPNLFCNGCCMDMAKRAQHVA